MKTPQVDLRYAEPSDVSLLKEWLVDAESKHWLTLTTAQEIECTASGWMGMVPYGAVLTATIQGKPCGMGILFLMPYKKIAHHAQAQLIVAPKWRRQGVGASLIKNLKNLGKKYFNLQLVHIELVEGHPFVRCLLQEGFVISLEQEKFFKFGKKYRARLVYEVTL